MIHMACLRIKDGEDYDQWCQSVPQEGLHRPGAPASQKLFGPYAPTPTFSCFMPRPWQRKHEESDTWRRSHAGDEFVLQLVHGQVSPELRVTCLLKTKGPYYADGAWPVPGVDFDLDGHALATLLQAKIIVWGRSEAMDVFLRDAAPYCHVQPIARRGGENRATQEVTP